MTVQTAFRGEIIVASRIVDYLSSGLYESPAACLKELVNNSFDADATRVDVFIKPDADRIIIADNGHGMSKADFIRHFSKISESHKRDESDHTQLGRPKIGKIGIGFIAANEICDEMEIYSTTRDNSDLLHVTIYFDKMRLDPEVRRREGEDFAKGDYRGEILKTEPEKHYTHVYLKRVRGEARTVLAGARMQTHASGDRSVYGLNAKSIKQILTDPGLRSWAEFDPYSQNFLQVALNVPVAYYQDWVPASASNPLADFEKDVRSLEFSLWIDGSQALKPVMFAPKEKAFIISRFNLDADHVGARGYFYAQHGTIRPQDLQGVLIRIRNAAIGGYDPTFLSFSPSEGPLFQSWISGEVWADDRLEEAMNIDRRTLRIAHPAYIELQEGIHQHLAGLIKKVRSELYGGSRKERRVEKAQAAIAAIARTAEKDVAPFAPAAAADLQQSWTEAGTHDKGARRLLRRFSVPELYEIVLEIARDILSPSQLEEFVRRLTSRLRK